MQYRQYGRFGYEISALGFGAMRLPMTEDGHVDMDKAVPMLQRAFDLGVNYVDSARGYCRDESHIAVGRALKGYRERVYLSTKNPEKSDDGDKWQANLEQALEGLEENYIDFYHIHCCTWEKYTGPMAAPGGPRERMQQALDQGLIRHRCFSSHDTCENTIKLIETGEFDGMLVQYNLLDRSYEEAIACAHEKGMGVAIMGTVGGGRLAGFSDQIRAMVPDAGHEPATPAMAVRFVLSNPCVTVALSGMRRIEEVEQNCRTAAEARLLDDGEWREVNASLERLKGLADLYCTGCNYCLPCPHGVDIPRNFTLMNYHRVYGLTEYAKAQYAAMAREKPEDPERTPHLAAACCNECGACLEKCPQKIPIIEQLKEVDATLGGG